MGIHDQSVVLLRRKGQLWMVDLIPVRVNPAEVLGPPLDPPDIDLASQCSHSFVSIGHVQDRSAVVNLLASESGLFVVGMVANAAVVQ